MIFMGQDCRFGYLIVHFGGYPIFLLDTEVLVEPLITPCTENVLGIYMRHLRDSSTKCINNICLSTLRSLGIAKGTHNNALSIFISFTHIAYNVNLNSNFQTDNAFNLQFPDFKKNPSDDFPDCSYRCYGSLISFLLASQERLA